MTPAADQLEIEPAQAPQAMVPLAVPIVDILGPDVDLPALIRFVPDTRLRHAADEAARYALGVDVTGPDGLQQADVALTALRGRVTAIGENFDEPTAWANKAHKRLTGLRAEWTEGPAAAVKTVGDRIYREKQRLDAIAAEERRRAQAEADRIARETARREAEAAAKANAPAAVVEEMKKRVETTVAAPVATSSYVPKLGGTTTVTTWKARPKGTPADAEPNPDLSLMNVSQLDQIKALLAGIIAGTDPIAAIKVDWSYLNKRAGADKNTFRVSGIEAFEQGGTRAKGSRL